MRGFFSKLFGRRTRPQAQQNMEPAAVENVSQGLAAAIGNQGMLDLTGNANPPTEEESQALQNAMAQRVESVIAAGNENGRGMAVLKEDLGASKKDGIGRNSGKFHAIQACIQKVNAMQAESLSGDVEQDQARLSSVRQAYGELLEACDTYIGARKPSTGDGKARLAIVKEIREQILKDAAGLNRYWDRLPTMEREQRAHSVQDVISDARTRKIKLKEDKYISGLTGHGGAISELVEIKAGDAEDESVSGSLKKSDVFEHQEEDDAAYNQITGLYDVKGSRWQNTAANVRSKMPLPQAQYEQILGAKSITDVKEMDAYNSVTITVMSESSAHRRGTIWTTPVSPFSWQV